MSVPRTRTTLAALEAANPALVLGKVNVDENPGLAKAAGIRGSPAQVLCKKGEPRGLLTGVQSQDALQKFVDDSKEGH